jgi:hypothetical protein
MHLNSYPKVWNFGHPSTACIPGTPCRVEEKVDGSQFSFGVFDGELHVRSRSVALSPIAPQDLFRPAVETVTRLHKERALHEGWTYRGEAFKGPKHNTLTYGRAPTGGVILFDIGVDTECYMDRGSLEREARGIGLEVVPCYGEHTFNTYEEVQDMLGTESVLGGVKIEGVVLKPVQPVFGIDAKPIFAKVVSAAFKELHLHNAEYKRDAKGDILTAIAKAVSTLPRWRKTVERLRDEGKLIGDPRDLQYLIVSLQQDIVAECEQEIKDALFAGLRKKFLGECVKGFPEWYKSELAKAVFSQAGTASE